MLTHLSLMGLYILEGLTDFESFTNTRRPIAIAIKYAMKGAAATVYFFMLYRRMMFARIHIKDRDRQILKAKRRPADTSTNL